MPLINEDWLIDWLTKHWHSPKHEVGQSFPWQLFFPNTNPISGQFHNLSLRAVKFPYTCGLLRQGTISVTKQHQSNILSCCLTETLTSFMCGRSNLILKCASSAGHPILVDIQFLCFSAIIHHIVKWYIITWHLTKLADEALKAFYNYTWMMIMRHLAETGNENTCNIIIKHSCLHK